MIDPDYTKAKTDWEAVQRAAERRFLFNKQRVAYLQVQAARITNNIDELCRLRQTDSYVFSNTVIGRWPYG